MTRWLIVVLLAVPAVVGTLFVASNGRSPEPDRKLSSPPLIGANFTHFAENGIFRRGKSTGSNVLMADGSVRFLNNTISPQILEALATMAGGEETDW